MDIGTGAGLAGATGVRPYLPPLLTGALARGDTGIDFDGTDWSFSSRRSSSGRFSWWASAHTHSSGPSGSPSRQKRSPVVVFSGVVGVVWARCCSRAPWPTAARRAVGLVAAPARRWAGSRWADWSNAPLRLEGAAAALITVYADTAALVLAALAIFVPPVSFLALIGLVLLAGGRRREGEKYAGLRVLRQREPRGGGQAEEARPGGHRLAQARDARSGHRGGPRAGAGRPGRARHLRARLRRRFPRSRRSHPPR